VAGLNAWGRKEFARLWGVGNADNQLEASKITFSPDEFAIEVAQEQQITANKSAAGHAQSTAVLIWSELAAEVPSYRTGI
jgi:hypothetical protein